MKKFEGTTVLVTGGASGIGKATVQHFLKEGASVIVFDVNESDDDVTYHNVDISDEDAVAKTFESIEQLDILVNNAGTYVKGGVEDITKEDIDAIFGVNLNGALFVSKHALPLLKKSKGQIVNIASMLADFPRADNFLYSMTKKSLMLFTEALAQDYPNTGVRVNAILPGPIRDTNIHPDMDWTSEERIKEELKKRNVPLGRFGTPDEVASLVLYICSEKGGYIHGASLVIDGGRSIASRNDT